MFRKACDKIRRSVYGFLGTSHLGSNRISCTMGTAFMIAPGVIVTAAHLVHIQGNPAGDIHRLFELIRGPDIGQTMERATLIAEDGFRDIALLRIENPRSHDYVKLERKVVRIGTGCGSLGFPLARIGFPEGRRNFILIQRFQGANISAFATRVNDSGQQRSYYETDSLMYRGSSGCPGFLKNSRVFGMHDRSAIEPRRSISGTVSNVRAEMGTRLAISYWVSSLDIIDFAEENGIRIR